MVRIGVVGAGRWGQNHLRIFSDMGCLEAVADPDPSKKEVADQYKTKFFTDYKKMLSSVDAVTVVVPTDLHYDVVKECLNAGKHVLVEKPFTLDSERAQELVELARKKKLLLSVGYLFRFNPAVIKLKDLLKDAGRIHYINARYIHSSKPPRKDSGAIFNLGVHMIDILNFVLEERPKRVYCKKINLLSEHEDSAAIILDYENFFAELEVSCCHPKKKRDMWVIAEKDKIYADFLDQKIIRNPFIVTEEGIKGKKGIEVRIEKKEPLKEELKHFAECVEGDGNGQCTEMQNISREEYYTTKICELALQSAKFRRDLDIE